MNTVCETIRELDEILSALQQVLSRFDRELIGEELTPF